jgi:hypothetical protein
LIGFALTVEYQRGDRGHAVEFLMVQKGFVVAAANE